MHTERQGECNSPLRLPQRRLIRLKEYDYGQNGAYFVTICTWDKKCLFGAVWDDKMQLSKLGQIVEREWRQTEIIRENVILDEFVIMPNHIHGILVIDDCRGVPHTPVPGGLHPPVPRRGVPHTPGCRGELHSPGCSAAIHPPAPYSNIKLQPDPKGRMQYAPTFRSPSQTVGAIVRGFKAAATRNIGTIRHIATPLWQRNYYEHVIRDEDELNRTREYIINNPLQWALDENNPKRQAAPGKYPWD